MKEVGELYSTARVLAHAAWPGLGRWVFLGACS